MEKPFEIGDGAHESHMNHISERDKSICRLQNLEAACVTLDGSSNLDGGRNWKKKGEEKERKGNSSISARFA